MFVSMYVYINAFEAKAEVVFGLSRSFAYFHKLYCICLCFTFFSCFFVVVFLKEKNLEPRATSTILNILQPEILKLQAS